MVTRTAIRLAVLVMHGLGAWGTAVLFSSAPVRSFILIPWVLWRWVRPLFIVEITSKVFLSIKIRGSLLKVRHNTL